MHILSDSIAGIANYARHMRTMAVAVNAVVTVAHSISCNAGATSEIRVGSQNSSINDINVLRRCRCCRN